MTLLDKHIKHGLSQSRRATSIILRCCVPVAFHLFECLSRNKTKQRQKFWCCTNSSWENLLKTKTKTKLRHSNTTKRKTTTGEKKSCQTVNITRSFTSPSCYLCLPKNFCRSKSPAHVARWKQIEDEIETTGAYHLTETELIYGAKMAWRNSSRCIGRIQWSKLQVSVG